MEANPALEQDEAPAKSAEVVAGHISPRLLKVALTTADTRAHEAIDVKGSEAVSGAIPEEEPEGEPEGEPEEEQVPSSPGPASLSPSLGALELAQAIPIEEEWLFQRSISISPSNIPDELQIGFASVVTGPSVARPSATDECNIPSATMLAEPHAPAGENDRGLLANEFAQVAAPVPPPPAPFFPVCSRGVSQSTEVAVDTTPCLVELAASAISSARTAEVVECPEDGIVEEGRPAGEECERLLPGLFLIGSCRSSSSRSSPAAGGSSRCDIGDEVTSTPRDGPPVLSRFLSPMSSCAPSPPKPTPPPAPASSPACGHTLPTSGSWFSPPPCESLSERGAADTEEPTSTAMPGTARDASAWFRAARRTLLPLGQPMLGRFPSLERLIEVAELSYFAEPSQNAPASRGALSWCCTLQPASAAMTVEVAAADSVPATEARLLSVPRPSMRGLRATSSDALLSQMDSPPTTPIESKSFVSAPTANRVDAETLAASEPRKMLKPPVAAPRAVALSQSVVPCALPTAHTDGSCDSGIQKVRHRPSASRALLPALPRQAPALPSRAPSGDNAADAAELLLSRVVDPFGEDCN